MAHPNEELLRKGLDAFSRGDLDTVRSLLDQNVVWHVPGRSPTAGDYKGIDEVFQFFGKTMEQTGGSFRIEVHDVLANDTHAVALVHLTADRDGKRLDDRSADVYHVQNGKVTEVWLQPGDLYAEDEFWS